MCLVFIMYFDTGHYGKKKLCLNGFTPYKYICKASI